MSVLHIDVEFARHRILVGGDRLVARRDAFDLGGLQRVGVLLQEGVAEDAEGGRVRLQLLDDEIVVLASIDIGAVLAHLLASGAFVVAGQGRDLREPFAAHVHDQFDEGVARAGGRRRAEHLDPRGRERRVDFVPAAIGIGDKLAVLRDGLGEPQEKLRARDGEIRSRLGVGDDDAVMADRNLGDFRDAILGAGVDLALLDPARGAGDIRRAFAHAVAEQLQSAAGAGRFHHRGSEDTLLGQGLGDRRGERIDGRGADDMELLARRGRPRGQQGRHQAEREGRYASHAQRHSRLDRPLMGRRLLLLYCSIVTTRYGGSIYEPPPLLVLSSLAKGTSPGWRQTCTGRRSG